MRSSNAIVHCRAGIAIALCAVSLLMPRGMSAQEPAAAEAEFDAKLLIAFSSYRERMRHPQVYFYQHDGLERGKLAGSIPAVAKRSDSEPSLSADGRLCAFAGEMENQTSRILVFDRTEGKLLELPELNESPHVQLSPSISGAGKLLAFAAWNHPKFGGRWETLMYDLGGKSMLGPVGVNTGSFDERMPATSRDGRWVALTSNATGGAGLTDVYLFDQQSGAAIACPQLNSAGMDIEPALSAGGRLLALVSDRPGGAGGRDIYLYDRESAGFAALPGVNSAAHEQSPSLSADGRYLAFVSERIRGEGERDIYLYDRQRSRLLPTPGLNTAKEEMDPVVIVLPPAVD